MPAPRAEVSIRNLQGAARRSQPRASGGAAGRRVRASQTGLHDFELDLVAAVLSVHDDEPVIEVLPPGVSRDFEQLPAVTFQPGAGRNLEETLRQPVSLETGHVIGYLQQLVAFKTSQPLDPERILIGYLALVNDKRHRIRTRPASRVHPRISRWQGCYLYLPWEDWRGGRPAVIDSVILPALAKWSRATTATARVKAASKAALNRLQAERSARVRLAFGSAGAAWAEEKVLARFELLAEAGLVAEESPLTGGGTAEPLRSSAQSAGRPASALGRPMVPGHRRILAAGLGRLRSDLQQRPVVFELMEDSFTLFELQRTVEIILGPHLHKQNFRRLIETTGLVEPTGRLKSHTGGRPAQLYRFRRDVLLERPGPGVQGLA